ncbi:hypothetical protein EON68_01845, partial [archaeon]
MQVLPMSAFAAAARRLFAPASHRAMVGGALYPLPSLSLCASSASRRCLSTPAGADDAFNTLLKQVSGVKAAPLPSMLCEPLSMPLVDVLPPWVVPAPAHAPAQP